MDFDGETSPAQPASDDPVPFPPSDRHETSPGKKSPHDSLRGQVLGGYRIEKKIGQGGMGTVFLAKQIALDRRVALKVLLPHLVSQEPFLDRFLQEARASARLSHPNIVKVYDAGKADASYYIAMEYIHGVALEHVVRRLGRLPEEQAVGVLLSAVRGLGAAAESGIIHRDVKPANIMISAEGKVKLMDFGLAKQVEVDRRITITGQMIGTPSYMSPEQCNNKGVDFRSDIYALGITLYRMLTGMVPFWSENLFDLVTRKLTQPFPDPQGIVPGLSSHVCDVIRRMTEREPDRRFQSYEELKDALAKVHRVSRGEVLGNELSGIIKSTGLMRPLSTPDEAPAAVPRTRKRIYALLAVLALVAAGAAYLSGALPGFPVKPASPSPTDPQPAQSPMADRKRSIEKPATPDEDPAPDAADPALAPWKKECARRLSTGDFLGGLEHLDRLEGVKTTASGPETASAFEKDFVTKCLGEQEALLFGARAALGDRDVDRAEVWMAKLRSRARGLKEIRPGIARAPRQASIDDARERTGRRIVEIKRQAARIEEIEASLPSMTLDAARQARAEIESLLAGGEDYHGDVLRSLLVKVASRLQETEGARQRRAFEKAAGTARRLLSAARYRQALEEVSGFEESRLPAVREEAGKIVAEARACLAEQKAFDAARDRIEDLLGSDSYVSCRHALTLLARFDRARNARVAAGAEALRARAMDFIRDYVTRWKAAGFVLVIREGGPGRGGIRIREDVRPFMIAETETTNAAYQAFLEATSHPPPPHPDWEGCRCREGTGDHPVTSVSIEDVQAYIAWCSEEHGEDFRLPTEREWSLAARWNGRGFWRYPWGDEAGMDRANIAGGSLRPVGLFHHDVTRLGVVDLGGNAAEIVRRGEAYVSMGGCALDDGVLNLDRKCEKGCPLPFKGFREPFLGFRLARYID